MPGTTDDDCDQICGNVNPKHNHENNMTAVDARKAVAEMKDKMSEISENTRTVIAFLNLNIIITC